MDRFRTEIMMTSGFSQPCVLLPPDRMNPEASLDDSSLGPSKLKRWTKANEDKLWDRIHSSICSAPVSDKLQPLHDFRQVYSDSNDNKVCMKPENYYSMFMVLCSTVTNDKMM